MIYNNENFTEQNDGERSKDWQKKPSDICFTVIYMSKSLTETFESRNMPSFLLHYLNPLFVP